MNHLPHRFHAPVALTPNLLLTLCALRVMRLQLELYMPRDKTRWN